MFTINNGYFINWGWLKGTTTLFNRIKQFNCLIMQLIIRKSMIIIIFPNEYQAFCVIPSILFDIKSKKCALIIMRKYFRSYCIAFTYIYLSILIKCLFTWIQYTDIRMVFGNQSNHYTHIHPNHITYLIIAIGSNLWIIKICNYCKFQSQHLSNCL